MQSLPTVYNYVHGKIKPKLEVSAKVAKRDLSPGNEQTIVITVKDEKSNKAVVGAQIACSFKLGKLVEGSADNEGQLLYTWMTDNSLDAGINKVLVGVSANGYDYASTKTEFVVEKQRF